MTRLRQTERLSSLSVRKAETVGSRRQAAAGRGSKSGDDGLRKRAKRDKRASRNCCANIFGSVESCRWRESSSKEGITYDRDMVSVWRVFVWSSKGPRSRCISANRAHSVLVSESRLRLVKTTSNSDLTFNSLSIISRVAFHRVVQSFTTTFPASCSSCSWPTDEILTDFTRSFAFAIKLL